MPTAVRRGLVVALSYYLMDELDQIIDMAPPDEPLWILYGVTPLLPGLDKVLRQLRVGDRARVVLTPSLAHGERDPELHRRVPRDRFAPDTPLAPGMPFVESSRTEIWYVVAIEDDAVVLSPQAPLAGQTLTAEVLIMVVRDATDEERASGHIEARMVADGRPLRRDRTPPRLLTPEPP